MRQPSSSIQLEVRIFLVLPAKVFCLDQTKSENIMMFCTVEWLVVMEDEEQYKILK